MKLRDLESRVFLALVLASTAFFVWVIRAFLTPVFWAVVFAVLFRPVFLKFVGSLKGRRGLAAVATTLTVVLVVLIPSALILGALAQQALGLYQRLASGEIDVQQGIVFVERSLPALTDLLSDYGVRIDQIRAGLENAAVSGTQYVASQAISFGQNALTTAILFGLMLYMLFFFLRDGDQIMAGIVRALPMGDDREQRLFKRFSEVSRATVNGTLIVATVQGTLGGIMFAVVGVEAAVFWGVVMGVLSLLPAVGPALVWVPAAAILFATGEVWQGVVVVIGGALVIGLVDNLLRPVLVGRQAKMPDYLVLLATLGGITVFGLAGFVAGPVIAALFLVMWDMFAEEYAPMDSSEYLLTEEAEISIPEEEASEGEDGVAQT